MAANNELLLRGFLMHGVSRLRALLNANDGKRDEMRQQNANREMGVINAEYTTAQPP